MPDVVKGAPTSSTASALAGSPNEKRSAVTCWKRSLVARSLPSTVPIAQSAAAVIASSAGYALSTCTSKGEGKAISQTPASPPTSSHAYFGCGRSPRMNQAPATAKSGWIFCRTTGVTGSPCTNACVKRIVAIADAPTPIAAAAST